MEIVLKLQLTTVSHPLGLIVCVPPFSIEYVPSAFIFNSRIYEPKPVPFLDADPWITALIV